MRDNYLPNPAQNSRGLMTKHKNDISEVGVTRGTIILSDIGHRANPTSEQNSLTYIFRIVCQSLTFNLELPVSESIVHNS